MPSKRPIQGIFEWMTSPQRRHKIARVNHVADFTGAVMGCCIIGFYIASVEMMIQWNHVTGVDTVLGNMGQLIPFLIGIGSMIAVILEWGGVSHGDASTGTQTVPEEKMHDDKASGSGGAGVDLERLSISELKTPQSINIAGGGSASTEKQFTTVAVKPEGSTESQSSGASPLNDSYYKRFWRWINEPLGRADDDPSRVWRWYTV